MPFINEETNKNLSDYLSIHNIDAKDIDKILPDKILSDYLSKLNTAAYENDLNKVKKVIKLMDQRVTEIKAALAEKPKQPDEEKTKGNIMRLPQTLFSTTKQKESTDEMKHDANNKAASAGTSSNRPTLS